MDDNIVMDLFKNLDSKIDDIKDDLTEVKVDVKGLSDKITNLENRKSGFSEFMSSPNLKYLVGGLVIVSILVVSIFNPAVLSWASGLIPFIGAKP